MMQNEYADPIGRNTVLNPKIWDHDHLKPDVRGALIRMAEDFLAFVEVPVDVIDIVITGGNAYDVVYTDGNGNLSFANLTIVWPVSPNTIFCSNIMPFCAQYLFAKSIMF